MFGFFSSLDCSLDIFFVEALINGVLLAGLLALLALGLNLIFGVIDVVWICYAELVMVGMYAIFYFVQVVGLPLPLAFVIAALVGISIERGIIRFLYGRPLETLLATWGLSLILQQAVRTGFGPTNKDVGTPSWMAGARPGQATLVTLTPASWAWTIRS